MTVAAVSRCLNLLDILAGARDALELSDLAARMDIPPSAAHRLVTTMANHGWVIQEPSSQKYALSLKMSVLAFRDLDSRNVPDVIQAVLNRLAANTQEYCRLAMLVQHRLVVLVHREGAAEPA